MAELGLELKCSNFQTRCSQRKTVTVIFPLLNTTGFHGNKITNTYPTEPLVHRIFDLQGTLKMVWHEESAEGIHSLLSRPKLEPSWCASGLPFQPCPVFFPLPDLHINVPHKIPSEEEAWFLQIGLKPLIA